MQPFGGTRLWHNTTAHILPGRSSSSGCSVSGVQCQQQPKSCEPRHFGWCWLGVAGEENGDVRPIVVGEVLRRLTSKCLCSAVSDVQAFFGSLQVGVACPLGLEVAIHTISQCCERNAASTSKIVMTINFHNTFNSLDRNAVLAACRRDFPTIAACASWCYSVPSWLLCNERVVSSFFAFCRHHTQPAGRAKSHFGH